MMRHGSFLKPVLVILTCVIGLSGCSSVDDRQIYDKMTAEALYRKAYKQINNQHIKQGIDTLDALEARYPFGPYAEKAQLTSIYANYEMDDYPGTAAAAERFIQLHPRHKDVDYAYYMQALSNYQESLIGLNRYLPIPRAERDISASERAYFEFGRLIERFPDSVYAPDSYQRMVYLKNIMAEHELVAARFYLEKKAYVAAASRAIDIIQKYDGTPALPVALYILSTSYRALALNDLADDTALILKENYARSPWHARLGES